MKKLFSKLKVIIEIAFILFICSMSIVLASSAIKSIPLEYNVLPTLPNGSPIDTTITTSLTFRLFQSENTIYYQDKPIVMDHNTFQIDITGLSGETTFVFRNANNEEVQFHYYLSDRNGKLEGFELVPNLSLNVFMTTFQDIKIIYTDKEEKAMKKMKEYIQKLPQNVLENVQTIQMIPFDNTSHIAGSTKEDTITLYQFSKYATTTQKNIIYHEIAHTWANQLMQKKMIDYSYTEYATLAQKDKKAVSQYAHQFTTENGRYSEDFADSVAFYFMSSSFRQNYPNRAHYIQLLLEK